MELLFDRHPLAKAFTWQDGKRDMHALSYSATHGPAFCGLDPASHGWENVGRLGTAGVLSHDPSCKTCQNMAMQAYVLRHLAGLGDKTSFSELLEATHLQDDEFAQALKSLNARGYIAGRPQADGHRRVMLYAVTVLGGELLDRDFAAWSPITATIPQQE